MLYTIRNEYLEVTVSDLGAELQSIRSAKDGREFLWQGDPAVWSGRSPLLFPVVGRLKNDSYSLDGKKYSMPKHGFARKNVFTAEKTSAARLTMRLASGAFYDVYPFEFELEVTYSLSANALTVMYRVSDKGDADMYFSIGAHPAFACCVGDRLEFPDDETAYAYRLDPDTMLLSERAAERGITGGRLTVTKELFEKDALIFRGLRSDRATLVCGGVPRVTVEYGSAPCVGVWAKPGAEYVCIEPWFGCDDTASVSGDIAEKPEIIRLAPGNTFRFPMRISFPELMSN